MDQSSSPTILQVLPSMETGGVEQTVLDVAESVIQNGWKALVVSHGGRMLKRLRELGATHLSLPFNTKNPFILVQNIKRLQDIIRDHHVSLVHARSRAPAWSAYYAAKWSGVPFVTTFHGTYNTRGGLKKFYNSIMTRGDLVIANSVFTALHIQDVYHTPLDRIRIIPRGVDLNIFDPKKISQSQREALKLEWGIDPGDRRPILMMPGRLSSWKGQKVFLEALLLLDPKEYLAFLVGDEQGRIGYRKDLDDFISGYNLEQNVKIVGHRSDMPVVLSCADVVISASTDPEAFGRVMAEAFAMERPVVATRHGGALEIVEDGKSGFLVEPGDSRALSKILNTMLRLSSEARYRMGCVGRNRVLTEFSKNLMCTRTLNVYKELL